MNRAAPAVRRRARDRPVRRLGLGRHRGGQQRVGEPVRRRRLPAGQGSTHMAAGRWLRAVRCRLVPHRLDQRVRLRRDQPRPVPAIGRCGHAARRGSWCWLPAGVEDLPAELVGDGRHRGARHRGRARSSPWSAGPATASRRQTRRQRLLRRHRRPAASPGSRRPVTSTPRRSAGPRSAPPTAGCTPWCPGHRDRRPARRGRLRVQERRPGRAVDRGSRTPTSSPDPVGPR